MGACVCYSISQILRFMWPTRTKSVYYPNVIDQIHHAPVIGEEIFVYYKDIYHFDLFNFYFPPLQECNVGIRRESVGVIVESELPHLIGMDDDLLSTGIILYHIKVLSKYLISWGILILWLFQ